MVKGGRNGYQQTAVSGQEGQQAGLSGQPSGRIAGRLQRSARAEKAKAKNDDCGLVAEC